MNMKKFTIFIFCLLSSVFLKSQCLNADSLITTNITYVNAQANWTAAPSSHHYLIHYRELGTTNWSNLGNIDSTMTSRNIPQLQQLTTYEWQIKTFCDSTNQPNSGWSYSDTFTTTTFVPAPFDPSILPIIANFTCNMNTAFSIIAQQQQNEPDISSSIFWSDKGYFEISTLTSGDVLGNASYTSSFLNFTASLVLDFTLGPNYAKIDMIDTAGATMGERGMTTITIAHITFSMAYVAIIIRARLSGIGQHLEEAAQDLGGKPFRVLLDSSRCTLANALQGLNCFHRISNEARRLSRRDSIKNKSVLQFLVCCRQLSKGRVGFHSFRLLVST